MPKDWQPAERIRYGRAHRRKLPPTPRLRELFVYNPRTGSLKFKSGRWAGEEAGFKDGAGYKRVIVDGETYQVHRLIWKMCAWKDPENEIDHKNGHKSDNSWLNLRPATTLQNGKNRPERQKNNSSGFKGVNWHKRQCQWAACITADGEKIHLGYFDDIVSAAAAYSEASARLHGAFARIA